jgi:hypothetical protein
MRDSSDTRCLSAPTALSLVTMKRLFMDSGGAFGGPPAQSGLAVKCLVAAPYGAVGHVRPTRRCRPDKRDVVSRLSGPRKQGLPSGSARQQAGAPMGSWHRPGTHGTPRQRRCDDPQGVAVLSGGCLLASRPDRTNKDSLLGSKQVDPWVRGTNQGPMGFPRQGDVPIWSSASRQTRGPSQLRPIHRCCGSARRGIATRPVRPAPTGTSSMGVPWQQQGPSGFLATRRDPLGPLAKAT